MSDEHRTDAGHSGTLVKSLATGLSSCSDCGMASLSQLELWAMPCVPDHLPECPWPARLGYECICPQLHAYGDRRFMEGYEKGRQDASHEAMPGHYAGDGCEGH